VLDGKRLAGVLMREDAQRAAQAGVRDISGHLSDMASVPASAGLDEVLARPLRTPEPLAVTGEEGEFIGVLSRSKVVELVTTAVSGDAAPAPDPVPAASLDVPEQAA
jgi:glycine betaine/proline transport system ATP-binding protein